MCGAWWLNSTPPCGEGTDETAPDRSTPAPDGEAVESSTTTVECDTGEAAEDLMHPLLLRCVAGGAAGLAAGPGAVPVADEPHGGQENLETSPSGMIIIDDMEENEKYSAKEAEEPSSRAGQGKVEIQTSDHDSSSSDRCCPSPRFLPTPAPVHQPCGH